MWDALLATLERYPAAWSILAPILAAAAWGLISGLFNSFYDAQSPHTDEEWAAAFAKHPRWAAVVSVFKTAGLNIPGLLRSLRVFFGGKLPDPVIRVVTGAKPPTGQALHAAAVEMADEIRASRVETPETRVIVVSPPSDPKDAA